MGGEQADRLSEAPSDRDKARRLLEWLVATGDVVIICGKENGRVLSGINAGTLRAIEPRLIVATVAGRDGDATSGAALAGLILAAWYRQLRTSEGAVIEVDTEATKGSPVRLSLDTVDLALDATPAHDNTEHAAPYGCYGCRGENAWLAITAETDEEWCSVCHAIGTPELAFDDRFATVLGRLRNRSLIDATIGRWTAERDKIAAMETLQAWGVPAGALLTPSDRHTNPHLIARGWKEYDDHQPTRYELHPWQEAIPGAQRGHDPPRPRPDTTISGSRADGRGRRPISQSRQGVGVDDPPVDQTEYVLRTLLEMGADDAGRLMATGVHLSVAKPFAATQSRETATSER
jgi:crotonobetainyl-CoA:carnitine CoA-transferase CaiB-like acyl-CoA transferase